MPKRNLIWVLVTLLVACAVAWVSRRPLGGGAEVLNDTFTPLHRLHLLSRRHYYRPVPPDAVDGAIRGYLGELDTYCRYIPPQRPEFLDRILHGRQVGLGIRYEIEAGEVRVIGPLPDSPAAAAAIAEGDVIVSVNGRPIVDPTGKAVNRLLRGLAGSETTLGIRRQDQEMVVKLTRAPYPIETVTGLFRDDDGRWRFLIDAERRIAYVRISEFVSGTGEKLDEIMRPLFKEGVRGMVLDLRDNPGGPLREAVDVADRFLDDGLIVLTASRGVRRQYDAHAGRSWPDMNVVVLINGATVSAPEVVAGAVRRHRRGVLIGERTYGKDVIQTPFTLGSEMGSVLLTTGRYAFAATAEPDAEGAEGAENGQTTADPVSQRSSGVAPHVVVEVTEREHRTIKAYRYRAGAVGGRRSTSRPAPTEEQTARRTAARLDDVRRIDTLLSKALDLLGQPAAMEVILAPPPATEPTR